MPNTGADSSAGSLGSAGMLASTKSLSTTTESGAVATASIGMLKLNVVPVPTVLATLMVPLTCPR